MSKCLLLFFAAFFLSISLMSQTFPKYDTLDFLKIDSPKKINKKNKSFVAVRVININRNLYTVESSSKEENINTPVPTIFSAIKLPGFLDLNLQKSTQELAAYTPGLSGGVDSISLTLPIISQYLMQTFGEIKRVSKKIAASAYLNNQLVAQGLSCGMNTEILIDSAVKITAQWLGINESVSQSKLRKLLSDSLQKFQMENGLRLESMEELANLYEKKTQTLIEELKSSIANLRHCIEDTSISSKERETCKVGLPQKQNLLVDTTIKINKELAKIKEAIKQATELTKIIEAFFAEGKANILENNFGLLNQANFTFETDIVKLKADELTFTIKAKSEKAILCNQPRERNLELTYVNKSGIKVDFSTGVFVNGGHKDFMQREYYYKTITADSVSIATYERGKRSLLSIGALMHLYLRQPGWFNGGLALGVSTTTGFDAINFHGGASLIFGRKDRIVLSGGLTLRESKVLADGKLLNQVYKKTDLPDAPPIVGRFPQMGFFVAVTYNWSKLQTQKSE